MTIMTAADIEEARAWIADCIDDIAIPSDDYAWKISPLAVARLIRRNYVGGIAQFLADK